jgi:sulfur carrier protein ThiS
MSATLRLSGGLKEMTGGKAEYQVEPGQSIRAALTSVGIVPETIALAVVNEEQQSKDYVIREGDVIRVLAIIGGG